ncbi:MAG: radical SAM protein [Acidobacteria bacterium]|nr:radical SAM protein [Acidobacteriota bacterium]
MGWSHFHNRLQLLGAYLRRSADVGGAAPINLIIENTSKCNLYCPMCPRELGYLPPQDLSLELFKRTLDQLKGKTELVIPWGAGEPLLNSDLYEMIRYAKTSGMHSVVSTNATLLNEERSHQLINSGLDILIIAFDGTTPEVYEKYRKGANFYRVRDNIVNFLEIKRRRNAQLFTIMQLVRMRENYHQISDYQKMWNLPGVDEIRVKEEEIGFPEMSVPGQAHKSRRRKNPCHLLWQGPPAITVDGNMFPCCHSWQTKPLGNIHHQGVKEIWNSPAMQRWRQAHISRDLTGFPDCQRCLAPNPRWLLIVGSFLINSAVVKRWVPRFEKWSLFHKLPIFEDRRTGALGENV